MPVYIKNKLICKAALNKFAATSENQNKFVQEVKTGFHHK